MTLESGMAAGSPFGFGARIKPRGAGNKNVVNLAFTMFGQLGDMAMSPVSGALSPTQQAVIEQIRALRAAKPPVAVAAAPAQAAPAAPPKPVAVAALDRAAASDPAPNRPRGSIINIVI
jgi:hypothetical protein